MTTASALEELQAVPLIWRRSLNQAWKPHAAGLKPPAGQNVNTGHSGQTQSVSFTLGCLICSRNAAHHADRLLQSTAADSTSPKHALFPEIHSHLFEYRVWWSITSVLITYTTVISLCMKSNTFLTTDFRVKSQNHFAFRFQVRCWLKVQTLHPHLVLNDLVR